MADEATAKSAFTKHRLYCIIFGIFVNNEEENFGEQLTICPPKFPVHVGIRKILFAALTI